MKAHRSSPPVHAAQIAHPWHGITPRADAGGPLTVFIEIVPAAALKFELDKASGWLRVDRPQQFTSRPPAMYGLIPQTYCGAEVARRCMETVGGEDVVGDGDPMDIIVLSHEAPSHGGFLVQVHAIGGLRMVDDNEADDKIVAVLEGDPVYGGLRRIGEVPSRIIEQLVHYFTTYKQPPEERTRRVEIKQIYDQDEAGHVIALSLADYSREFLNAQPPDVMPAGGSA